MENKEKKTLSQEIPALGECVKSAALFSSTSAGRTVEQRKEIPNSIKVKDLKEKLNRKSCSAS